MRPGKLIGELLRLFNLKNLFKKIILSKKKQKD